MFLFFVQDMKWLRVPSKAEQANIPPKSNPLYIWPPARPKQTLRQCLEGLRKISTLALDLQQSATQVHAFWFVMCEDKRDIRLQLPDLGLYG